MKTLVQMLTAARTVTQTHVAILKKRESKNVNYTDFLKSKIELAKSTGFDIAKEDLNDALMDHQKDAVQWALKGGHRALFESYGLGKSVQQIEFLHQAIKHEGGKGLIVCPLGVKQEFWRDSQEILGYEPPKYVRTMDEVKAAKSEIVITNYERVRDGNIDPSYFTAASLDEASILRSFGSKTNIEFREKFKGVKYKCVATATPSPNQFQELLEYADYLEVMDLRQSKTRFFRVDHSKVGKMELYPNQREEFWLWVSSWALFIEKPSDLDSSYSDEGYDLPPYEIRWHELPIEYGKTEDRDGQVVLFPEASGSLSDAAKVKRDSITQRVAEAKKIIDESPEDHFILWHSLESERAEIKRQIPEAVEIYGSLDLDKREQRTLDFSNGKYRILATKESISGSGCNFQKYCHREIFVGIDYKANDFMQALHRVYRFLQKEKVIIDIIYMENERTVKDALMEKWKNHDKMVAKMTNIVREYGLNNIKRFDKLERKLGVDEMIKVEGKKYIAVNEDTVKYTATMPDESVDLIHTSIPFGTLYEYSQNYADFGHNKDTDSFFTQMDYLTPELYRILKPGRIAAIHVKDRILSSYQTKFGMQAFQPFHAEALLHYIKHGFICIGMITVVTDVVMENNQSYRLGWSEQCKDGSKMGVGAPEYILLMRKLPTDRSDSYSDVKVSKSKEEYTRGQWQIDAHAYWRSSGDRLVTLEDVKNASPENLKNVYTEYSKEHIYNYEEHVELCKKLDAEGKLSSSYMMMGVGSWNTLDVWDDISRTRTLNTTQKRRDKQAHLCPLQQDIVERIINRYSNPGEVVYDPFGGIGTVPMTAVKMGRFGQMCELNPDYFSDAVDYLQNAENEVDSPTLFDFLGIEKTS